MKNKLLILLSIFSTNALAQAPNIIFHLQENAPTIHPIRSAENQIIGLDLGKGRTVEYVFAQEPQKFKEFVYPRGGVVQKTFKGFINTKVKGSYTPKDREFFFGVLNELYSDIKNVESLEGVFTRYFAEGKKTKTTIPAQYLGLQPIWSDLGSFTRGTLLKAQLSYDIYGIALTANKQQDELVEFDQISSLNALKKAEDAFNELEEKMAQSMLQKSEQADPYLATSLVQTLKERVEKCNPAIVPAAQNAFQPDKIYTTNFLDKSPLVVSTLMPDESNTFKDKFFVKWDTYSLLAKEREEVAAMNTNPTGERVRVDANVVAALGQSYLTQHAELRKKYVKNISRGLAQPGTAFPVPDSLRQMILDRIVNPTKEVQINTTYGYLIDAIPCAL